MVPKDLKYTSEHEWVRVEGDVVTIGISDYAQQLESEFEEVSENLDDRIDKWVGLPTQ